MDVSHPSSYTIKLILVGDSGTGKSCMLYRYISNGFSEDFQSTIGVEFGKKHVYLKDVDINERYRENYVKVQIWDTAGQERFRSITTAYYRGTAAVIAVYDVSNLNSFLNIKEWIERYFSRTIEKERKYTILAIVGNKIDKTREVSIEQAASLSKEINAIYFETSCKTGAGVHEMFELVIKKVYKNIIDTETMNIQIQGVNYLPVVKLDKDSNLSNNKCC
jgi:small GTP-binding protein